MVINCNGILKEDDSLIKSKIILVTGGLGFIGSHFIKLLLNEKNKYKIVNVDVETYAANLCFNDELKDNPNYIFYKANICNKNAICEIFESYHPDIVVNFAAETNI